MKQGVLKLLKKKILNDITAPCLARVLKGYAKKEKGGYHIDGEKLVPGTLEKTGEAFKGVPCNPIWTGPAGQGLYCPPAAGQIAVINFIGFDAAFPFVAGYWSDEYTPAEGKENTFILTDGMGGMFELSTGFFVLENSTQSLKAILENLITTVAGITTTGPPSNHAIAPPSQIALNNLKLLIGQLFSR